MASVSEAAVAYLKHREAVQEHPCFNAGAHHNKGRVHLPVSPACNIQCRFCRRDFNRTEERPGVASGILPPEEAADTVARALELCPQITVAGIAGPGDTLASSHGLRAFANVHARFPDMILCMSTNGLLLSEKIDEIVRVGVKTLTVTVNAVDPVIGAQIVSHVIQGGVRYEGEEGARRLIAAQLSGLRMAAERGLMIKVNTVLIPGINDAHIADIARTVKAHGADLYNIIPLIPEHELSHIPAPTCEELNRARDAAEVYLPQFRHCRHCRADACGIVGKVDLSAKLYGRQMETFSHG